MVVRLGRVWVWRRECWSLRAKGYLALPCFFWVLSPPSLHPPPQSPFYYSNWEQNIWTQHCFWVCSCIPSTPPPPTSLCRALTSPLGLSKNKESLQGREWVGTAHREYTEPQMWGSSVQCSSVFLESHDNLTLPMPMALETLKMYTDSFHIWKFFRTLNWKV